MDTASAPMVPAGPPPIRVVKRRHFKALGFARFMASVHVVCDHFYPSGFGGAGNHPGFMKAFNSFGGTWVPFFFLLSGFVITYAKFSNPKNPDKTDPLRLFMRKRLTSIYPLFAFSIFVQFLLKVCPAPWGGHPKMSVTEWCSLPFTLALLHAWSPYVGVSQCEGKCCVALGAWNTPTWFLCCLLIYWIAWSPLYHFIRRRSINQVLLGILLCGLYSFLWPIVFIIMGKQFSSPDFYDGPLKDIAKFNPLSFWHIYVWGMLLSRLFIEYAEIDLKEVSAIGRGVLYALRYGATIGYVSLFAFMIIYGEQKQFTNAAGNLELFFRAGGLLPFHTLIIWGLSEETDPIARLFATYPFTLGELVSFPQYVMQSSVQQLWSNLLRPPYHNSPTDGYGNPWWYNLTLYMAVITTAYLCAKFVDAPYRAWLDAPVGAKKPPPKPVEKKAEEKKPELPLGAGVGDVPLVPPSPQMPAAELESGTRELTTVTESWPAAVHVGAGSETQSLNPEGELPSTVATAPLDGRECTNCSELLVKDAAFCHMCGEASMGNAYAVLAEPVASYGLRQRPGTFTASDSPARMFTEEGSYRAMRQRAGTEAVAIGAGSFKFMPRPGLTDRQEQAEMDLRESLNSF